MSIHDWRTQHEANLQALLERHMATWAAAVDPERDLVCLDCYAMGPWLFCYQPMMVQTGNSDNPVVVLCPCGAGLTIEQGLALKQLHGALTCAMEGA